MVGRSPTLSRKQSVSHLRRCTSTERSVFTSATRPSPSKFVLQSQPRHCCSELYTKELRRHLQDRARPIPRGVRGKFFYFVMVVIRFNQSDKIKLSLPVRIPLLTSSYVILRFWEPQKNRNCKLTFKMGGDIYPQQVIDLYRP